MDENVTVDRSYYIDKCVKPVIDEIWKQRPIAGTKGVKLLHDNARAHIGNDVLNYLKQEGVYVIPHPPYSPDLAPCDYWLNDYIKRNLTDQTNSKSLLKAVSR